MKIISGMSTGYQEVLHDVSSFGSPHSPREEPTRELSPYTVCILNPMDRVCASRNNNFAFGYAEFLSMVYPDGFGAPSFDMLVHYCSSLKKFLNTDDPNHGIYGLRIVNQVEQIISLLEKDNLTRRAVITINYSKNDLNCEMDIPCTLSLQFMFRGEGLDCHVYMRSNDVWLGFPNDVFSFTLVQEYIALRMGWKVGQYYHTASSMHVYEEDLDDLGVIINSDNDKIDTSLRPNFNVGDAIVMEKKIRRYHNWEPDMVNLEYIHDTDFLEIFYAWTLINERRYGEVEKLAESSTRFRSTIMDRLEMVRSIRGRKK